MATQLPEDTFLRQSARTPFQLEKEIGAGGEGRVYRITGESYLAAKIYYHPDEEHMVKLSMMLMRPPLPSKLGNSKVSWPVDGIMDERGTYVGFLMPIIDKKRNVSLSQIYNPGDRANAAPNFTWKSLLTVAANIASLVSALHAANYVVGDLNESNILVNKASGRVTLIDCDSIQVPGPEGKTFRCSVGKAEYTPPELQGVAFDEVDRLPAHDNFGLAILIFQLLMEGVHPFTGSSPDSDTRPLPEDNIRNGQWPFSARNTLQPPPHTLPLNILPPVLQMLMQRCFEYSDNEPLQRPGAQEWLDALDEAHKHVKRCDKNKHHWYSDHLAACPWCNRKQQLLGFDTFAAPTYRFSFTTPKKSSRQRPAPAARPSRGRQTRTTRTGRRQHPVLARVFGFIISTIVVISCTTALNAMRAQSSTSTTVPTFYVQPVYTPPPPQTCPPGEFGIPPNCQSFVPPTLAIPTYVPTLVIPSTLCQAQNCPAPILTTPTPSGQKGQK
jgi:DNA-binding helix-hairpin-helix protein with protein kinase domain